jgi:predicted lipase
MCVHVIRTCTHMQVHLGFYTAYQRVRDRVRLLVRKALSENPHIESVTCTGHSLGAALSGVAALDIAVMLSESNPKVSVGMTNFGMPRVGNKVRPRDVCVDMFLVTVPMPFQQFPSIRTMSFQVR